MSGEFETVPVGKLLALDQQFFRREFMLDEDRGAFRDETETRQAVVGALPPGDKVPNVGDLLGEIARVARIAGQPALDFLPDDLPKAELGRWRRNALQ